MRLQDRVAVVTGGGGGIGSGICLALAREGADVVVSDIDLEAAERCVSQVREQERGSLAVRADVTVAQDCLDLVEAGLKAFGKVDVLVNNAGLFGKRLGMPFTNQEEEDWDNCYRVNVKGPFLLSKAVAPHMMERRYGKIINISSIAARRDAQILPDYTAAKNALLSLTRVTAKDLAPYNVTVNAICPGMIWSPFWHRLAPLIAAHPDYAGLEPRPMFEKYVKDAIPMQREQTPEDIGHLAAFLASDEARNITGQTICVDGGAAMG
jgi:NAD(P)-dependent dehydrogenase (short-subunit alcohol dehydrogenase family)